MVTCISDIIRHKGNSYYLAPLYRTSVYYILPVRWTVSYLLRSSQVSKGNVPHLQAVFTVICGSSWISIYLVVNRPVMKNGSRQVFILGRWIDEYWRDHSCAANRITTHSGQVWLRHCRLSAPQLQNLTNICPRRPVNVKMIRLLSLYNGRQRRLVGWGPQPKRHKLITLISVCYMAGWIRVLTLLSLAVTD